VTQDAATPAGFWERVGQIAKKAVDDYVRAGLLNNASISSGGLTIKGGALKVLYSAGQLAVYFGGLMTGGTYAGTGILITEPSGTNIASFSYNEVTSTHTANLHDGQGNVIVGNDSASGQGLARPYVPMSGFGRARYADWTIATSSVTFETLWRGEMLKQHPQLSVATLASADTSGATGEIRVLVNGTQIGTTQTVGFAQTTSLVGPAPVAGTHMQLLAVEIQARLASGTGSIKVEPLHCIGRQS
jgi:hypothetical protein